MSTGQPAAGRAPVGSAVGLVLPGGGARAAYQVGVLKAISEILPNSPNPFPVIVGTSAGAVAAAVLGSEAFRWHRAVKQLEQVWANFTVEQVFHADALSMLRSGVRWGASLLTGGLLVAPPRALFDNSPLWQLLRERINFRHLQRSIEGEHLRALAICASSYTTATSVAFYQGDGSQSAWRRQQRVGAETTLRLEHVMASLAVPFLFPPVAIGNEYFGDGAQRQLWPLSPAIHLGADRLLVIGVRAELSGGVSSTHKLVEKPPSTGQLFGYMLDTLFMDQIYANIEHIVRLNQVVEVAPNAVPGVHKVATMMIAPSTDLRLIAERHARDLPRSLRALLRVMGARGPGGSQLASFLMFDGRFTGELIALGYRDAMLRQEELKLFLGGQQLADTIMVPQLQMHTH